MNLLAAASISEFRVQTIGTCWLLLHELQGDVLNYYWLVITEYSSSQVLVINWLIVGYLVFLCKFWTWSLGELENGQLKNGDASGVPVFALAGNCYCKLIYYFQSFTILICAIIYFYLKNSKTYPCIGFFRKLPYPRIRILPIPMRVSVSVLHRCCAPPQYM